MSVVSDPGRDPDIMRELRELRQEVAELRTVRRLESAAIGAGGLRVIDGGRIEILDGDGEVQLTLAAEGMTMQGLLSMLGGVFEWRDGAGTRRITARARLDGEEANVTYYSGGGGPSEAFFGTVFAEGSTTEVIGHGLVVTKVGGGNMLRAWSHADGTYRLALVDGQVREQITVDEDGLARPLLSQHFAEGWFGATIEDTVTDWQAVSEGWVRRTYPTLRMQYRVVRAGTPTVQVRLRDMAEDQVIAGPFTHAESNRFSFDATLLRDDVGASRHQLEARVTGGAGSARIFVTRCEVGRHT